MTFRKWALWINNDMTEPFNICSLIWQFTIGDVVGISTIVITEQYRSFSAYGSPLESNLWTLEIEIADVESFTLLMLNDFLLGIIRSSFGLPLKLPHSPHVCS